MRLIKVGAQLFVFKSEGWLQNDNKKPVFYNTHYFVVCYICVDTCSQLFPHTAVNLMRAYVLHINKGMFTT
jgi:hypothetical protein